ncbi:MAG: choice-of-anchor D domain-containing protein, partial [Methylovulum sp.]|nr:choice-of-anchor D domain-containing protein [Methylovulum sp.]
AESALYIAGNTGELTAFKLGLADLFVPASLPIKATPVNTTNSRAITLTNVGDRALTISSIASGSPVFVASSVATPFVLAPNQSKIIHISFMPTSATVFNADLTINSDDPNEPVSLVHLQGKGI